MTILLRAIEPSDVQLEADEPLSAPYYRIDSEVIRASRLSPDRVFRAQAGTAAAAHTAGAVLTPLFPSLSEDPLTGGGLTVTDGVISVAASTLQVTSGSLNDAGGGTADVNPFQSTITKGLVIYPDDDSIDRLTIGGGTGNDEDILTLDTTGAFHVRATDAGAAHEIRYLTGADPSTARFNVRTDFDASTFVVRADGEVRMEPRAGATSSLTVYDAADNPIFRVDTDGSVHIKTGTTIQADL